MRAWPALPTAAVATAAWTHNLLSEREDAIGRETHRAIVRVTVLTLALALALANEAPWHVMVDDEDAVAEITEILRSALVVTA